MTLRLAVLALAVFTLDAAAQPKKKEVVPSGYKKDDLRGFTLYLSDQVLREDKKSTLDRKPLEALEQELIVVESMLPADKLKKLKAVPIWVEWNVRLAMGNGRAGGALAVFYGGHQAFLLDPDSPLKTNSVTILSLESLAREHQPKTDSGRCVTLHELAHAFHYLVVGENPLVKTTFVQAKERKLYDPELYAATNEKEYFAELTCAYFDRLDYVPRNRAELKKHDPKGYDLMYKLWGPIPEKKDPVAAKGPKLASPDGDGKFSLDMTTDRLAIGPVHTGTLPPKAEWAGRPALVFLFPVDDERAVAMLPRMEGWYGELKDLGLIAVASEIDDLPSEEARALARTRGITFPFTGRTRTGAPERTPLPHTLVYDHQGKCVFRGALADAEPYARIAVGKAVLAKADLGTVDKPARPVVDLLEQAAPVAQVLAKLADQLRLTNKDAAGQLVKLQTALTEGGKKVLDAATEKAKDDPVDAFFEAERLPVVYKGTPLEKPATDLLTKLRKDAKVGVELRARPYLEPMKKLDVEALRPRPELRPEAGPVQGGERRPAEEAGRRHLEDAKVVPVVPGDRRGRPAGRAVGPREEVTGGEGRFQVPVARRLMEMCGSEETGASGIRTRNQGIMSPEEGADSPGRLSRRQDSGSRLAASNRALAGNAVAVRSSAVYPYGEGPRGGLQGAKWLSRVVRRVTSCSRRPRPSRASAPTVEPR